jgi:hypothetical protein
MPVVVLRGPRPFHGKWIAFRPWSKGRPPSRIAAVTCFRCRGATSDPGGAGWYYRRGEAWRLGAHLCPGCLVTLQRI